MTVSTDPLSDPLADGCLLERELGESGMATAYLAKDLKHNWTAEPRDKYLALVDAKRPSARAGTCQ